MELADRRLADFEARRAHLVRLGYRMLGSVTEAEDVVQDAWLRWAQVDEDVQSPPAYLTRIVTRLCLDRLKSARVRRETYVGTWLPEPLVMSAGPTEGIGDDIGFTLMVAMERLSPLERAAFLLHDVFDVPLTEIAATIDRQPAAVRQLASRARRRVRESRTRFRVDETEAGRIGAAFFAAARNGDVAALSALLAREVEIHTDGGGKVSAFRNVVRGFDRAIRLFAAQNRKKGPAPILLRTVIVDGLPGYLGWNASGVFQAVALEIDEGKISAIYIVSNPDKLSHLPRR